MILDIVAANTRSQNESINIDLGQEAGQRIDTASEIDLQREDAGPGQEVVGRGLQKDEGLVL